MNSTEQDSISIVALEAPHSSLHEELTSNELLQFQLELAQLLEKRTLLYTSGESSSVPELTAYRLLSSVCFVLDIDADAPNPTAIRKLLEEGVKVSFEQKLNDIGSQVKQFSSLWEKACLTTPLLKSIALKDTLESLRDFSVQYDYRYFAHEIPSDIDYPLCHPVAEPVQGVAYVTEYLNRLVIENSFLNAFELKHCKQILTTVHPGYQELLINLFEPIAVNALGVALAEGDIRALKVTPSMRNRISEALAKKTKQETLCMLKQASDVVFKTTKCSNCAVARYLEKTAVGLYSRLAHVTDRSLGGIFLSF